MAIITRPGPHGTTMKPYGSFAGKASEAAATFLIFLLQLSDQYSGGVVSKEKRK